MKYLMEVQKNQMKYHFIYIFLFYLGILILKTFSSQFFDKKFKNSFGVIMDDEGVLYVVLTLIIFMIIKSKFF